MERPGGEPDVVGVKSGEFVFMDCSAQSPKGRVSFCYDRAALDSAPQPPLIISATASSHRTGQRSPCRERLRRVSL
jgi:hypothetical protein